VRNAVPRIAALLAAGSATVTTGDVQKGFDT
jgi:hypothetical protein